MSERKRNKDVTWPGGQAASFFVIRTCTPEMEEMYNADFRLL